MLVDCLLSVGLGFYVGCSLVDLVCWVCGDCGVLLWVADCVELCGFYKQVVYSYRFDKGISCRVGLFCGLILAFCGDCIDFARFWGIGLCLVFFVGSRGLVGFV